MERPETSDAELLARARRDPHAFALVYDRHAEDVFRWMSARVDSRQVALELTAEVFAQVWIARRRFKPPDDGSAGPWIHGIARNVHLQLVRRRRVEAKATRRLGVEVPAASPEEETHDRLEATELGPDAMRLLRQLPAEQREAVTLRVLHDLSYEEIAVRMQSSVELARTRVSRGLGAIRDGLTNQEVPS